MKKESTAKLLSNYLHICKAAEASNDGHRCMIAPSPEIREKLKKELKELKKLTADSSLSFLLQPRMNKRLGLNDSMLLPGNMFPIGSSVERVRSTSSQRTPLRGRVRVIVVMAEFADKKFTTPKNYYKDLFFSTGQVATGSVKEYFTEVSDGQVEITGEVVGPFKLPQKMAYYANGESGTGNSQPNARTMAQDAAKLANSSVIFSNYDNDSDGYVDAFVVVHAGRGAEETANPNEIWSHKWLLPQPMVTDNTTIYSYLTIPEDCKLGVCAHELGHLLFGFPDLYDTEEPGEGVGNWCLMGGGSWNDGGRTPAHPCAWCKEQQGWVKVVRQTTNQLNVAIEDVKKSKQVYRLWKDGSMSNEYFLVENRQRARFDKFLPGEGLLIWHVDNAMYDNTNEFHYKVALMQADGKKHLELGVNRGDANDAWPARGKTQFSARSRPNSYSYGNLPTDVQVRNIKETGVIVTADLYVKKSSTHKVIKVPKPAKAGKTAKAG